MPIRVRAKQKGYFGQLRKPGDVFTISNEAELGSWMERLDPPRGEGEVGQSQPNPARRAVQAIRS